MSAAARSYGGRYAVEEKVGSGGMAEVYRARDELLGREVAIKVLSERFSRDRSFVERFRREAQSAANLNHPNIVSLYDYGADDGTYFIVMEFIDGRSLADVIAAEGPLMPERAAEIAADVARALERAHQNGLVHRDIKPGNIMLTSSGQAKVTDFGIARALDAGDQAMTQTGMVMGTAAYLSPEQAQGDPVDARSDVYSMGCVLYEMLTGRPPFGGDTPLSIAYKHVRETAPPPSALNPDVPGSLDAVVMRALAKNPANRYASAQELNDDLQRFLGGRTVQATPLLADQTRAETAVRGTQVLREEEYEEEAPPRGRRIWPYLLVALAVAALLGLLAWWLLGRGAEMVEVPDVVGDDVDVARVVLRENGLESQLERRFSRRPVDEVLEQDPEPGQMIERGEAVTLVVSRGRRQTEVPDVRGRQFEEAETILEEANLRVGEVERRQTAEAEPGTVLEQEPQAGNRVNRGARVDLVVAEAATVTVPDVRGQSEDQARSNLDALGLEVAVESEPNEAEEGTVFAQSPQPQTQATVGDTVTIVVSEGPEEFDMPDVRGQPVDRAENELENRGLEVERETADPPCEEPPNRVCEQDPDPGSSVREGDEVTIYVQPNPAPSP